MSSSLCSLQYFSAPLRIAVASVVSSVAVPGTQLFAYIVLAIVAGTISAYFPARRAARMNVLDAIAHE